MKVSIGILGAIATGILLSSAAAPQPSAVQVWLTTIDQKSLLSRQTDLSLSTTAANASELTITVNDQLKYQEMDGFGASITDSSAFLLQKRLAPAERARVMKDLFSRDGIHLSLLRQTMGACDYSMDLFTYDESKADVNLEHFSIAPDRRYILPGLKEALSENPQIKVIATPWTPPSWMKTNNSMLGGHLKPECYQPYAEYFARFVESYRSEGVPIYAVTLQNEPLFEPLTYPSTLMPAAEEAAFVKVLGPVFEQHKLATKLIIYDHNWDRPDYPLAILADPEASKYVAGVAWHGYGGRHEAMSKVHDAHPDKGAWFTESSGGNWVPAFHDAFQDEMQHVVRATRNWSKSVVWWNLALDSDHGPSLLGDKSTCRGLVTIDQCSKRAQYTVDYYTMGHASKFVETGARRIESNTFEKDVEDVAFQNPDGSKVMVVSNRTPAPRRLSVQDGARHFDYTLPGEAAATFKW